MPNWCHNKLLIEGSERELQRFSRRVASAQHKENEDDSPLYFSSLVPEPVDEESDSGLIPDWYSWRVENWGTKWEPNFASPAVAICASSAKPESRSEVISVDHELLYSFDTAWSPPNSWVERASRLFPSLRFTLTYGEVGCDFAGREVFVAGNLLTFEPLEIREALAASEMWF